MNLSKYLVSLSLFPLLIAAMVSVASGQTTDATGQQLAEPTYEVALHVVIGSNETASSADMPPAIANVVRGLRGNFPFSNYRLASTLLGRVSNTGTIEYKSVSNIVGQADAESHTFIEWSMTNLRAVPNGFQARSFRFGARVPIRIGTSKDSSGTNSPVVNYESVGLMLSMVGLPANTPTLVGTVSLPKTSGTIFLFATVRPAAM